MKPQHANLINNLKDAQTRARAMKEAGLDGLPSICDVKPPEYLEALETLLRHDIPTEVRTWARREFLNLTEPTH